MLDGCSHERPSNPEAFRICPGWLPASAGRLREARLLFVASGFSRKAVAVANLVRRRRDAHAPATHEDRQRPVPS